jgi:hypothetical protein
MDPVDSLYKIEWKALQGDLHFFIFPCAAFFAEQEGKRLN